MNLIRDRRKALGMSQGDLARVLGITQGAVSQWESGITLPAFGMIAPLANALEIPIETLLKEGSNAVPDNQTGGGASASQH